MTQNINKELETGRSMVEMLGTLAIIGVLSVGSIAGYRYAMEKYRTNEITETVSRMAIVVSSQLMIGREASLREFDTAGSGVNILGDYPTSVIEYDDNTFGIEVQNLSGTLCESIDKQEWPVLVDLLINNDDVCQDENNTMTFVFDNDLGKHEGCLGGYTGENCDEKIECENGGEWTPTGCECPEGWYGPKCDSDCDGFKDSSGNCITCSNALAKTTSKEECSRCDGTDYPRFMGDGKCIRCSNTTPQISTETECAKCDGTKYPRYMTSEGKCARSECDEGYFADSTGLCLQCWKDVSYTTTPEECAKCDDRLYSESDGTCYRCFAEDSFTTTPEECARCSDYREYDSSTEQCVYKGCPSDRPLFGKDSWESGEGTHMPLYKICHPCSSFHNISSTKEECDLCPGRTYYNGKCLPSSCPEGYFESPTLLLDSSRPGCIPCEASYRFNTTKEICDQCPNRRYSGGQCWPN